MGLQKIENFDEHTRGGPFCNLCGSGRPRKDKFVFRGPLIEYEGTFDICGNCIREHAGILGLLSKNKSDQLRQANEDLRAENAQLRERINRFYELAQEALQ